ncbi:hypothetical protein KAR91_81615 [Candidatus Pacearchaeota archaeon]|nr:hypothetical protein [Candidatus Pacearchaeota archaeon]
MDKLKKCSMPSSLVAVFFLFCIVAFSGLQASLVNAEPVPVIDNALEVAVLSEDWGKVAKLLDSVTPETPSPVLRMIKGHADLALNRNNGSVTLFYSMTVEDMGKYAEWGKAFVSQNNDKSMAHYFQGDVYSRVGDLDQAHKHFTKSIETHKDNYLALNARGVISTLRKDYDGSMKDFNKALSIKPDFIDVNNNIAMMRINQGQGRKGAIKRFQSVIKSDSSFALAYHGLGCLELLKVQKLAPVENPNIRKAFELMPVIQDLFLENEARFEDAYLDKQAKALVADIVGEGTTIEKTWQYKKARIDGQIKQVENAQKFYDSNKFNVFNRGIAKKNLTIEKMRLAEISGPDFTSRGDWTNIAKNDPNTAIRARNIITSETKQYGNIEMKAGRAERNLSIDAKVYSGALIAMKGVSAYGGATSKVGSFLTGALATSSAYNSREYGKIHTAAGKVKQFYKRSEVNIPVMRSSASHSIGSQGRVEPSRGSAFKGVTPPHAVNNPGGATTNKAYVTWDDNKWPFIPIFGLMYFAPQTKPEVSGG